MFKLVICDDEGKTTIVPLIRDEVTIGRREGNTIRLTDRNVSRNHARLTRTDDTTFRVEDLSSRNGTKINNDPVTEKKNTVTPGDQIYIGDYNLSIRTDVAEGVPMGRQMDPGDNAGIGKVTSHARLVMLTGITPGKEFDLNVNLYVLGRSEEANLRIDDPSISRAHARLDGDDHQWTISDLDSINGILVNGVKRDDYLLKSGDIIELGTVQLRFVPPGEPYEYRPPSDGSVAADTSSGKPNKLFVILGAIAVLAIVAILAVVFLVGSSEEDDVDTDGTDDAQGQSFDQLMEAGKDKMQAEEWAEASRFFAEAIGLKPDSETAREFKKTALSELESQSGFNTAVEAQQKRNWKKAVDAVAAIPRSSHYYDKDLVTNVSDALCVELTETAKLYISSGNIEDARATLDQVDELPIVSDTCAGNRDKVTTIMNRKSGSSPGGGEPAGVILPAPKPVEPNPYGSSSSKPKPSGDKPVNPYANPYDTSSKKKSSGGPAAPAASSGESGSQVLDRESPPPAKGPKKITWGN